MQTEGSRIVAMITDDTLWHFLYYGDALVGFEREGETYYYLRNLQGDIVQIIDEDGEEVVYYRYDDWGKILDIGGSLSASIGMENPFRYRGYVYDEETGLYYLNSRYYDPETGRFISADGLLIAGSDLKGMNLFAYCGDNPVHYSDASGNASESCYDDGFDIDGPYVDACGGGSDGGVSYTYSASVLNDIFPTGINSGYNTHINAQTYTDLYYTVQHLSVLDSSAVLSSGKAGISCQQRIIATKGTPNSIGKAGEQLAGINQKGKTSIEINGRIRIPDGLNSTELIEVKNVKYISNTLQLRDYADYANDTGRAYYLYVRPTTVIAKSVISAGWEIRYLW